jgi:hypothetical protein
MHDDVQRLNNTLVLGGFDSSTLDASVNALEASMNEIYENGLSNSNTNETGVNNDVIVALDASINALEASMNEIYENGLPNSNDIDNSINAIQSNINQLDISVNTLENKVITLSISDINGLDASLASYAETTFVEETITNLLVEDISNNEFISSSLSQAVRNVVDNSYSLSNIIQEVLVDVSGVDSRIDTISNQVNDISNNTQNISTVDNGNQTIISGMLNVNSVGGMYKSLQMNGSFVATEDYVNDYVDAYKTSNDISINRLDSSVNALETRADGLDAFITNLDSSVNALESRADGLDASITNLDSSVNALESRADGLDASITKLDISVNALESRADGWDTSIHNLDISVNALESRADGLDASITNLDISVNALESRADGWDTSIHNLDISVNALETRADGLDASITNLDSSMNTKFDICGGVIDGDVSINGSLQIGSGTLVITENSITSTEDLTFKTTNSNSIIFENDITISGGSLSVIGGDITSGDGVTRSEFNDISTNVDSLNDSIANLDSSITILDNSINYINSQLPTFALDASLDNYYTKSHIDSSINSINSQLPTFALDASLDNYYTKTHIDASINSIETQLPTFALDASLDNYYTKTHIDSSINSIETQLSTFNLDNYYTKSHIDSSMNTKFDICGGVIDGDVTITDQHNLIVTGDTTINQMLQVNDNIDVSGNITANNTQIRESYIQQIEKENVFLFISNITLLFNSTINDDTLDVDVEKINISTDTSGFSFSQSNNIDRHSLYTFNTLGIRYKYDGTGGGTSYIIIQPKNDDEYFTDGSLNIKGTRSLGYANAKIFLYHDYDSLYSNSVSFNNYEFIMYLDPTTYIKYIVIELTPYSSYDNSFRVEILNTSDVKIKPIAVPVPFGCTFSPIQIGTTDAKLQLNLFNDTSSTPVYINSSAEISQTNFTGQHHNYSVNEKIGADLKGFIVVSTGTYKNQMDNCNECNKYKVTINESLPIVDLSKKSNDKKVFGVISDKDDNSETKEIKHGYISSYKQVHTLDRPLTINSVGEGAIWVCNVNGAIENGDYITSSPIPGLGMIQNDDFLRNYTVAKSTMDCEFSGEQVPQKKLRQAPAMIEVKEPKLIQQTQQKQTHMLDDSGNIVIDYDGNPVMEGVFDESGNPVMEDVFDESGNPVMVEERDSSGNIVKVSVYDESGNILMIQDTYANGDLKYDPVVDEQGNFLYDFIYDDSGNQLYTDKYESKYVEVFADKYVIYNEPEKQTIYYTYEFDFANGSQDQQECIGNTYVMAFVGCTYHCG